MTTLWHSPHLDDPDLTIAKSDAMRRCELDDLFDTPNLEGSLNEDGTHSIVLDLDCEHEYRPSSTPGHGHLIVKARLPWYDPDGLGYQALLRMLARAGVIEGGWLAHAERRKGTFVRRAGVYKTETSVPSAKALPEWML